MNKKQIASCELLELSANRASSVLNQITIEDWRFILLFTYCYCILEIWLFIFRSIFLSLKYPLVPIVYLVRLRFICLSFAFRLITAGVEQGHHSWNSVFFSIDRTFWKLFEKWNKWFNKQNNEKEILLHKLRFFYKTNFFSFLRRYVLRFFSFLFPHSASHFE